MELFKYLDRAVINMAIYAPRRHSPQTRSIPPISRSQAVRNEKLLIAIRSNEIKNVRDAIEGGADINAQDKHGFTQLFPIKNTEILNLLIKNGADINAKDKYGATPLHCAIRSNNTSIIELLLNNGADINAKDNVGKTPLHCAIRNNNTSIIELLLNNSANPFIASDNYVSKSEINQIELIRNKRQEINSYITTCNNPNASEQDQIDATIKIGKYPTIPSRLPEKWQKFALGYYGQDAFGFNNEDVIEKLFSNSLNNVFVYLKQQPNYVSNITVKTDDDIVSLNKNDAPQEAYKILSKTDCDIILGKAKRKISDQNNAATNIQALARG